ncbi:MAG: hypothetical protein ACYC4L_12090 [Chloroflexota bacterium]
MITQDEARVANFEVVRDIDAGTYLETLLVAAIASVLGIRTFLGLTGFPQLGGGGFHIAHMLWGGLLMLVALVILLTLLGTTARYISAVVGGLGFGAFFDELGKFITSDNDYFYRPTIALIYLTFLGLFFLFRAIERRRAHSRRELLVNAANSLVELILDRASPEERTRALFLLDQSGDRSAMAEAIRRAVEEAAPAKIGTPSRPVRARNALRNAYADFIAWRWFHRAVAVFLTLRVIWFVALAAGGLVRLVLLWPYRDRLAEAGVWLPTLGVFIPAGVAAGLAFVGAYRLRRSRLEAYRWLKRSLLVSILVVQVFHFYEDQLSALGILALDLVLLVGLNYFLSEESARLEARQVATTTALSPDSPLAVASNERPRERSGA